MASHCCYIPSRCSSSSSSLLSLLVLVVIITLSSLSSSLANAQHVLTAQPRHSGSAPSTTSTLGQAYGRQQLIRAAFQQSPTISLQSPASLAFGQAAAAQQYQPAAQPQYIPQQAAAAAQPIQYAQAAAPVAPAAPIAPSTYGWQVQHQFQQPQPAGPAAAAAAAQPGITQQHLLAAQQQQIAAQQQQQQYLAQAQPQYQTVSAAAAPASAAPAQLSPLHRPASVHYAQIGENLAGDYKFGYRTGDGNSFREESRLPDGTVQGQYGFVDADGKERVVKYTAGVGGFQVLSGDGAGPATAPAVHAAPIGRSVAAAAAAPVSPHSAPVAVALPQWAQSHLNGANIPPPPQPAPAPALVPQQQQQYIPQALAAAQQQYAQAPVAQALAAPQQQQQYARVIPQHLAAAAAAQQPQQYLPAAAQQYAAAPAAAPQLLPAQYASQLAAAQQAQAHAQPQQASQRIYLASVRVPHGTSIAQLAPQSAARSAQLG